MMTGGSADEGTQKDLSTNQEDDKLAQQYPLGSLKEMSIAAISS
jgi:hypothetical protein